MASTQESLLSAEQAKRAIESSPINDLLNICQVYVELDTDTAIGKISPTEMLGFLATPGEEREYAEEASPTTRLIRDVHYAEVVSRIAIANNVEKIV